MDLIVYRTRWGGEETRHPNCDIHEFRGIESIGVEKQFPMFKFLFYFCLVSIAQGPY